MTEFFAIFFQIIILNIFFLFPLNINNIKDILKLKTASIFDVFIINILFYCNILLLFSFFKLNLHFLFFIFLTAGILSTIFNIRNYYKYFNTNSNLKNFIFFLSCLSAICVMISSDPILSWDGIGHWYYKALNYHQGGTYENLKNLPIAYYPHLGGYIWSFFWANSLLNLEYLGRFFYIFIFLSSIFSATNRLDKKINFHFKIVITLIFVIFTTDKFILGGYQEYFLFYLFYSFSFLFYQVQKLKKKSYLEYFLIISSVLLMFWVKQEGFFYVIILAILLFFFIQKEIYKRFVLLVFFLISLYFFSQIKIYFHGNFSFNEEIFHSGLMRYLDFKTLLFSLFNITVEILKAFIKYPLWIIITLVLVITFLKNKIVKDINLIFYIFYLGFIYAIYLQTNMGMDQLMPLTLDRVLFHGTGFYLMIIVNFINKELCKSINS
jgi:hypothetical protein